MDFFQSVISRKRLMFAGLAGLLMCAASTAHAAPPDQLKGKSIVINWTETRQQRDERPDGGGWTDFKTVNARHLLNIYVSTAGRVFSRQTNTTGQGSGSVDQVAGERGGAFPTRTPSFSGRTMTIVAETRGGARRTVVEFDAGFASCSARTATAFQEGQSSVSLSPISKRKVEIKSVTASGASCSVQSGNVLGGPS